jgi:hypothetical protein
MIDCQVYVGPYIKLNRLSVQPRADEAKAAEEQNLAPAALASRESACYIPGCQHWERDIHAIYVDQDNTDRLIQPDAFRMVHLPTGVSCYLPRKFWFAGREEHGQTLNGTPAEAELVPEAQRLAAMQRFEEEHHYMLYTIRIMHPEAKIMYGVVVLPLQLHVAGVQVGEDELP